MAHDNIEIEIKVKVERIEKLEQFLEAHAQLHGAKRQVDEYFTPETGDFMSVRPVNEWLRLRDAEGKYTINYKLWHRDNTGKSQYCDEIETSIGEISQGQKILQALHFRSLVVVDKVRTVWTYKDFEIGIDAVQNLGTFIEIEYIGTDSNASPKVVMEEMIALLQQADCGKISQTDTGYPMLLLYPQEFEGKEMIF